MDEKDKVAPENRNRDSLWRGVPLSECSREELLECINFLTERHKDFTTPQAMRANALGRVEMMRRGEF